jgi:hypothetical protein
MVPSLFDGTEMQHRFQELPPSIRVVQSTSKKSSIAGCGRTPMVCDVAYFIEIRLFLKGRAVCEATREIMVMPVAETPPPIDPEDLRNEYCLFASSPLGISWRRRHCLMVSVASLEPQSLLFNSASAKEYLSSTELLLTFSVRQMLADNDSWYFAKPEITNCDITITLEATTYFLPQEEQSVLSVSEARDRQYSVVKMSKFKTQSLKFRSLKWDKAHELASRSFHSTERH